MTRQEILDNLLMVDLLGLTSLLFVSLLTYFMALRWPAISRILYAALIIRIITILIGAYLINLPDSEADARTYEVLAYEFSKNGFINMLNNYPGPGSFFLSWVIAIPYSLFGRSMVMAQSISLFFGICTIFLSCLFARKLWNEQSAKKVGWFVALFPSFILYSVLPMREVFTIFFFTNSFIWCGRLGGKKKFYDVCLVDDWI